MVAPALFHVQFDIVQRSKGQHAVKVAAYNAAARFEAGDGQVFDFRRKAIEHEGHAVLLPEGAPTWAADAAELWRRAEAAERRGDAQPARLVEFSIPRVVPAEQRMDFARAVIQPFVDDGMAAQLDLHCVTAADGQEQPHAHVVLSMRRFDGDSLAKTKERAWNQQFQADKGRTMRAAVAERMNDWLESNALESRVDHRSAEERGDDTPPERDVPKRTVEAWKKDPTSDAAQPFRQALENRETRRQLRRAKNAATAWSGEARRLDGALRAIEDRAPGARRPGRRRSAPPSWNTAWTPPEGDPHFAACEIRGRSALLSLVGGGTVIDCGSALFLRGRVTDESVAALAVQTARHDWHSGGVEVTGDAVHRDRLAAALVVRGIRVTNATPSRLALRQAEKVLAAERKEAVKQESGTAAPTPTSPIRRAATPRPRPAEAAPVLSHAPAYRPSWASGPRKPGQSSSRRT